MIAPLAGFLSDYPDLEVHLRGVPQASSGIDDVQTGQADMAFMTLAEQPPQGLDQHPVVRTPWSLVTTVDDPLGSCHPLRLEDINTHRLITMAAHVAGSS